MADTQAASVNALIDSARKNHHTLKWRQIGPFRGGRSVAAAGHPAEAGTFYFGACAGGVWKTIDGAITWQNVSDGYFNTAAIGAIAIADSDPNVVYAGTGETAIRGNVSHGDGIYKSTDGGATWTNVGLSETRSIARIRIDPRDANHVYVAALGHAWGPNEERGVYRTTDGGKSWEKILYRSPEAGAIDLSMDPHNPRILYATMWQAQRFPWGLSSGGEGSGIFKSIDGGDSWTEITHNHGLPKGVLGKIGIAVSPARPDRVYAIVEAEDGALFRSDDAGLTWQRLSEQSGLRWRAWYYMHMFADPQDADTCWVLNGGCWKSIDGGKSFRAVPTPHGDNHDLWIDPHDSNRMIEANDGGACVTYNGGRTWSSLWNQPTAQFYHVTTDNQVPYTIYGSQQDNTALGGPSFSPEGAILQGDWFQPGGGESGYIAIKPTDPNVVYGGAIGSGDGNGRFLRYDRRTGHVRNVTPWPVIQGMGEGAESLKYRFQWTFPAVFSTHEPNTLYVTSNHVHRTRDDGASWEVISPDLTRNDPAKLGASGGPITKDNTGAELYCTIFAFAESSHTPGVFWAGSDDGLIHRSDDGSKTWTNITPPASVLPEWALISIIELSPHDPHTAYVAATRYKHDDFTPYLLKTADDGKTWTRITEGIPANEFTRTIREDPSRQGLLYAGTETGVYVSLDDGSHWERFQLNLPVVPIYDLMVKGTDLLAATHGRSFWVLDDLTPLHQLQDGISGDGAHLFTPRETLQLMAYEGYGGESDEELSFRGAGASDYLYTKKTLPNGESEAVFLTAGKNPPSGVVVNYWLNDKAGDDSEVTLAFLDSQGNELHSYSSKEPEKPDASIVGTFGETPPVETRLPAEAGLNRFVWDMRVVSATALPGDSTTMYGLFGPVVPPGSYQARLSAGGKDQTVSFSVAADPRIEATEADLQAQYDLLLAIRDKLSATHESLKRLRSVRDQVQSWEKLLGKRQDSEELAKQAGAIKEKLTAIEGQLVQAEDPESPRQWPARLNAKLAALSSAIDMDPAAPSRQAREAFSFVSGEIDTQLDALQQVIEQDVAAFSRSLQEAGIPAVLAE